MHISIVIPVYNESTGIEKFHYDLLIPSIKKLNYELIYVNDGSNDDTLKLITKFTEHNKQIKIVDLSKNFGKEIATSAGISISQGDATIILDADGQHPPEYIKKFIKSWQDGSQVIIGVRNKQKHEGIIKQTGSILFYKIFNSYSGAKIIPRSTDFRLIDREVRNQLVNMTERSRITRGLIDWLGFKRSIVYFDSPERLAGVSSYKTGALIKLAINSFTSLSLKPLYFFGWVGGILMTMSTILGTFIIAEQYVMKDPLELDISGTAMLSVFILFLISLILISQTILSIYVARIYEQSQSRPLFVINKDSSVNIDD